MAKPDQRSRGVWSRLREPVDVASLVAFRIAFGLLMVWHILQHLVGGALEKLYLDSVILFTFPGFEWRPILGDGALRALFVLLLVAALGIAAGAAYRLSCVVFALGYAYVFFLDKSAHNNHTYLIWLIAALLAVVPAHRSLSIDARWRPRLRRATTAPRWTLWLLRFQVGLPYFFGGIAKLNADWLLRAQPLRLWIRDGTEGALGEALPTGEWFAYLLSWGGAALDLFAVPALLWRRTRRAAFTILVLFHLSNFALFNIGIFPWLMIAATALFFPPSWPRRWRRFDRAIGGPAAAPSPPAPLSPARALGFGVLALYVLVQLALPLRHWFYPGNVDWTEEGHTFAWRMKLRDKRGSVKFVAVEPASRKAYVIEDLSAFLTRRQQLRMEHDPDMIRQAARVLGQRLLETGHGVVEVRMITSISFNGRPAQPMIDPRVYASQLPTARSLSKWIMLLREP